MKLKLSKLPRWWPLAAIVLAAAALLMWRVTRDLMLGFLGIPVSKPNPPCSGIYMNSIMKPCLTASQLSSSSASYKQAGMIDELLFLDSVPGQVADPAKAMQ